MRNHRNNLLSLYAKKGYDFMPIDFELCPSQVKQFKKLYNTNMDYREYFDFSERYVGDLVLDNYDTTKFLKYFDIKVDNINHWGIGSNKGSEACAHMTRMVHPMKNFTTIKEFEAYPYPDYLNASTSTLQKDVKNIKAKGYIAKVSMACTIWEISWYLRSMEQLMSDMILNKELATYHFDRITEISCHRAKQFALAGVDIILLGDDIGMQNSIMMSEDMYTFWLKPRLKKIVKVAKDINPNVLIEYHSCGYIEPFIPHLIECGIDILNPIQPESMDYEKLYNLYKNQLSFKGTIGTQTTMPFGTPTQVKEIIKHNLDLTSSEGGLFICPTHLIEPEVPFNNIIAYIETCKNYK